MIVFNKERFNVSKNNICKNKQPFSVECKRGNRILFVKRKAIYKDNTGSQQKTTNKDKSLRTFCGTIKKHFNNYLINNNFCLESVKNIHPARKKNRQKYNELDDNSKFVSIDVDNCYWQILYNNGYIPKKVFNKYHLLEEYKKHKIMSLTTATSPVNREYYFDKFNVNTPDLIISCDNSLYKQMFNNVRYSTYNALGELAFNMLGGDFLYYNTDGIYFKLDVEKINLTKSYFNSLGLTFKISLCEKIDDHFYKKEGKIKPF